MALTDFDYYHAFLGLLGPDDVKGQRPTQQGAEIKVDGKGGDIKINDTAKVRLRWIQASNARIYLIDTVLDPAAAAGGGHALRDVDHHAPRRRPRHHADGATPAPRRLARRGAARDRLTFLRATRCEPARARGRGR